VNKVYSSINWLFIQSICNFLMLIKTNTVLVVLNTTANRTKSLLCLCSVHYNGEDSKDIHVSFKGKYHNGGGRQNKGVGY
jgi:hypothetical protein